jgi:hypothetical protein
VDFQRLDDLERRGYTVLEAVAADTRTSADTFSRPTTFICIDGRTYWVKGTVQQGLVAELVAGRLAARVGAGPAARIVRVTAEILPPAGQPDQVGVVVGIEDIPDTVNARDLGATGAVLPGAGIDAPSRALVTAFQTWLGVGDTQVLVRVDDGHVFSIDHGEAFGLLAPTDPTPVVVPIPGVDDRIGRRPGDVLPAVARIAGVTDRELMDAVAGTPAGGAWRSDLTRRREIVEYLAYRRDRLQEVMDAWCRA